MRTGEPIVDEILRTIEDDEALSAALGVDLTPPGPEPEHAPSVYVSRDAGLSRSEEVHEFVAARFRSR
jgi:hypothetical protein